MDTTRKADVMELVSGFLDGCEDVILQVENATGSRVKLTENGFIEVHTLTGDVYLLVQGTRKC